MTQREEIAWLAGLIDGEGSFSVGVHKNKGRKKCLLIRPRVAIAMYTGRKGWADKVSKILTDLNINHARVLYKANHRKNHVFKESYTVISLQGKEQIRNLSKILIPYLVIKKEQAKLFATFPQKRYIYVDGRVNKIKIYWDNIYEVVDYLRKSRQLNRGLHNSNEKWTPDAVIEYFKSLV